MGPPSYTWSVVNQNIAIQSMTVIQLHCIASFRKVGQRLSFLRCVCAKPFTKCEAENVQTKWFRIYHWNLMTGLGVTNIIINAAWVLRGDSQEPRQAQTGYEVCGHLAHKPELQIWAAQECVCEDPGRKQDGSLRSWLFFDSFLPSFTEYTLKAYCVASDGLWDPTWTRQACLVLTEPGTQLGRRKEGRGEEQPLRFNRCFRCCSDSKVLQSSLQFRMFLFKYLKIFQVVFLLH